MTGLTRFEFFVKDEDVGVIQRLLIGKAIELKQKPVLNARLGANGVQAATGGSNICEMFANYLIENKLTEVTPSQIDEFCATIGRTKSARYYCIDCGKSAGYLRKTGKGKSVKYTVNLAKAKKGV